MTLAYPVRAAVILVAALVAAPAIAPAFAQDDCGLLLVPLRRPYADDVGFSVMVPYPSLRQFADTRSEPTKSPIAVCENGKRLGPGHVDHVDIFNIGMGRYSHYGDWVRFSASDNTDPNTNGREYDIALNDARLADYIPKRATDDMVQSSAISMIATLLLTASVLMIALQRVRKQPR